MAPNQTTSRTTFRVPGGSASTAIGVYVPAMNTKIIEWSARFIQTRARGEVQTCRW